MKDKIWKILAIVSMCLFVVVIATSAYTSYSYEYTLKDVCSNLSGMESSLATISIYLSGIEASVCDMSEIGEFLDDISSNLSEIDGTLRNTIDNGLIDINENLSDIEEELYYTRMGDKSSSTKKHNF